MSVPVIPADPPARRVTRGETGGPGRVEAQRVLADETAVPARDSSAERDARCDAGASNTDNAATPVTPTPAPRQTGPDEHVALPFRLPHAPSFQLQRRCRRRAISARHVHLRRARIRRNRPRPQQCERAAVRCDRRCTGCEARRRSCDPARSPGTLSRLAQDRTLEVSDRVRSGCG